MDTEQEKLCCCDLYSVHDLLREKFIQGVIAVRPDALLSGAAELMLSAGVGSLLVMDGPQLLGMLTERDVVRTARDGSHPQETLVREVMNTDVISCGEDASVDEVAELMRAKRVRHLPVVGGDQHIVGVVSIGDVNAHRVGQCQVTLQQLEHYVYRRA
jgi:CBS domain-containing protein